MYCSTDLGWHRFLNLFVLLMRTDPEPHHVITLSENAYSSVVPANTRRNEANSAVNTLEIETWMSRIAPE